MRIQNPREGKGFVWVIANQSGAGTKLGISIPNATLMLVFKCLGTSLPLGFSRQTPAGLVTHPLTLHWVRVVLYLLGICAHLPAES